MDEPVGVTLPTPTIETNGNIGALYAALAKAQGVFEKIPKNRTVRIPTKSGGAYTFKYADLDAIIAATRKGLSENSLCVYQPLVPGKDGKTILRTVIGHASGATLSAEMTLPGVAEIDDPKVFGAVVSYFRRYQRSALLDVAADDDLDEGGGDDVDPAMAALLQRARDASLRGSKAYEHFFLKEITGVERASLKDHHGELKEGAAKADKHPDRVAE